MMVFAGPGNNGADALAVARMLADEGYTVTVLLFNVTDRGLSDACRHYRDELTNVPGVSFTEITNDFNPPVITRDAIVIDGLFGSGLKETA